MRVERMQVLPKQWPSNGDTPFNESADISYYREGSRVSEVIKGYVRKISIKEGTGKRGPWKLYSAKVSTEDGSGEREPWYSMGFDAPGFAEGDYIQGEVSQDGKYTKLKATKAEAPKAVQAAQQASSTSKEQNINLQSARSAAISLIALQIERGGLTLPKKAPDIYSVIRAAVDKETVQFYHDATTGRLLESVADGGALEEPPTEADAAASDGDDE